MNLRNFVDVSALKAKVDALNEQQSKNVDSHPDTTHEDVKVREAFAAEHPAEHPHRKVDDERIKVLVNEAVNAASKEIIAAAKAEAFDLVKG